MTLVGEFSSHVVGISLMHQFAQLAVEVQTKLHYGFFF